MRVPAIAVGANRAAETVAVFGYGEFGQAAACLLSAGGHKVRVLGGISTGAKSCEIYTQNNAHYTTALSFENCSDIASSIRGCQSIIACVSGTEYGALCEDLAPVLSSGQTLFLMGAAFGAALEVDHLLSRSRSDLALNIVELCQPFESYKFSGTGAELFGVKQSLNLAGRSLNETRAGLSAGTSLFSNLVPASNLLERGFSNVDRWLQTAAILLDAFADHQPGFAQKNSNDRKKPSAAVLVALYAEIKAIARAYGVTRLPAAGPVAALDLSGEWLKQELGRRIVEDFIILSSLARIVYLPVPILESVIELSSVVTDVDLRKEGRELSDLGLIGMDSGEIVEHVSA